jgi:hypothetical protein
MDARKFWTFESADRLAQWVSKITQVIHDENKNLAGIKSNN